MSIFLNLPFDGSQTVLPSLVQVRPTDLYHCLFLPQVPATVIRQPQRCPCIVYIQSEDICANTCANSPSTSAAEHKPLQMFNDLCVPNKTVN